MENIDFSKIFHKSSKDLYKGHPTITVDTAFWPPEWKTTCYKTYPRLEKIALPKTKPSADIFECIRERRSRRVSNSKNLTREELAIILQYSCGFASDSNGELHSRAQPSGGARFPIETYALVLVGNDDLPEGLYHYGVRNHELSILRQEQISQEEKRRFFTYSWARKAAVIIFLTSVFSRTQAKYGERGYRYILLEAGHIGQNVYLTSQALGVKCCALSGTNDSHVEGLLDIDGQSESLIYTLAIGK